MSEPIIKPEPDTGASFVDEVDETPDLEFFDKLPDADAYNRMYLTRLPNYVWEAWSKLDDDDEIEIGTVRQWTDETGKIRLQMRLRPEVDAHKELPKEYDMDVTNHEVNNTFVFSEQDLPSYAAKNKERANALAQGIPAHLLRKQQKQMEAPAERGKKSAPYSRRPIPKKTKVAGRIKHEVVCTPVRNAEADRFLSIRAERAAQPQKKVTMLTGFPTGDTTNPIEWDDFLKTREKPTKAKKMENKATRWPENKLLDAITKCFSEHKYWSIKAFRGKIPQPEAYLRETLEKIALLHRSGTFANHWSLKPEYQDMMATLPKPADDAAVPKADVPSEDEDEEDIKMEDVL
ncbi:transcription initiation factor IIF, beta subunit-domain-containing protein [Chaetomium sp. MPI-SDFR-AT-0129]|nr:transcription initiation factor IIF, beta subunit-domain-containing protein [Chaetomium sp. MPI-SDFR-AT-0129]